MKAFKAFIKPFEAPQGSVKIKIYVNFYFNIIFLNAQLSTHSGMSAVFQKCANFTNCDVIVAPNFGF